MELGRWLSSKVLVRKDLRLDPQNQHKSRVWWWLHVIPELGARVLLTSRPVSLANQCTLSDKSRWNRLKVQRISNCGMLHLKPESILPITPDSDNTEKRGRMKGIGWGGAT